MENDLVPEELAALKHAVCAVPGASQPVRPRGCEPSSGGYYYDAENFRDGHLRGATSYPDGHDIVHVWDASEWRTRDLQERRRGDWNGEPEWWVATYTTSALAAADHVLLALYAGDADFKSSQSAATTLAVNKYPTTTVISSNPNPSSYGQAVTLTAQVTTSGPSSPTGSMTFLNGTTALGATAVNGSGIATLTTKLIPLGSNQLTATYGGSPINGTSASAPITQNVNQAVISMTLTSTPNPSIAGNSVTLTAKLTSNGGLPVASAVTFSHGSSTLGTADINGAGVATFSTAALPQGSDQVTATYAGSNDCGSAAASLTQVVNP